MGTNKPLQRLMPAFFLILSLSSQIAVVLSSPLLPVPQSDSKLLILQDDSTTTKASTTTPKDEDKGKSWMKYVWIALGVILAVVIISCVISYLFCACVKEIICLPFTCIKGVLCCCCGD